MSDGLKKAMAETKEAVLAVRASLERVEALQNETAAKHQELAAKHQETADQTAAVRRHFDTFLVRFEETNEMLVTHDTEQLQRVTAVENENAALRQQFQQAWQDIIRRVDALEKKAG